MTFKKFLITLGFAFIGWAFCGMIMMIGPLYLSMTLTLILHAVLAPAFFALLTYVYYKKFGYTTPLVTALIFVMFVIIVDAGLVAPVFVMSFEMFKNIYGTWIPFTLIFLAALVTGKTLNRN